MHNPESAYAIQNLDHHATQHLILDLDAAYEWIAARGWSDDPRVYREDKHKDDQTVNISEAFRLAVFGTDKRQTEHSVASSDRERIWRMVEAVMQVTGAGNMHLLMTRHATGPENRAIIFTKACEAARFHLLRLEQGYVPSYQPTRTGA